MASRDKARYQKEMEEYIRLTEIRAGAAAQMEEDDDDDEFEGEEEQEYEYDNRDDDFVY
ncbi:hypothetical protein Ocin01_18567 [Orchesella cincta]|uniref:Uncharacterized protein n=1 Tax=Orchesella cincta TaxID=48709 RepID=A0A1D2M563_ORCCI|nr:hypothetical protein Ocin01_18567 [Orchesella cincta]